MTRKYPLISFIRQVLFLSNIHTFWQVRLSIATLFLATKRIRFHKSCGNFRGTSPNLVFFIAHQIIRSVVVIICKKMVWFLNPLKVIIVLLHLIWRSNYLFFNLEIVITQRHYIESSATFLVYFSNHWPWSHSDLLIAIFVIAPQTFKKGLSLVFVSLITRNWSWIAIKRNRRFIVVGLLNKIRLVISLYFVRNLLPVWNNVFNNLILVNWSFWDTFLAEMVLNHGFYG